MRNPYQRKAASPNKTTTVSANDRYRQFIERLIIQRKVYGLYTDGWAICATPTGQKAFPLWQDSQLARLCQKDVWANYQIEEVHLKSVIEKLIPYNREHDLIMSLNLTPDGQNILVKPDKFLLDIKNFIYQIYLQRPDLFKELDLPMPRSIRINTNSQLDDIVES